MCGTVIFQLKRGTVQTEGLFGCERVRRDRRRRGGREVEVPIIDPLSRLQVLPGVLIGNDGCSFGIQPFIAVGVIEVPVTVDQMFDGIATELVCSLQESRARHGDSGVDEHLSVSAGEDGDVGARPLEDADIATKPVNLDRGFGRVVADQFHDVAGFGIGL
jgi:hypothetical protein